MGRNLKNSLISILILLIAIALGTLAGKYFGQKESAKARMDFSQGILNQMKQLKIGDTLENHKFEVLGDDSAWLKDLLSERCVLTVVLPECNDCITEAEELKLAIKDSSDARHFIFATWDNPRIFEEMKKETELTAPFLYDHRRAYFSKYEISAFPFNITLDKNGVVLDVLAGPLIKQDFEEIINYNKIVTSQ